MGSAFLRSVRTMKRGYNPQNAMEDGEETVFREVCTAMQEKGTYECLVVLTNKRLIVEPRTKIAKNPPFVFRLEDIHSCSRKNAAPLVGNVLNKWLVITAKEGKSIQLLTQERYEETIINGIRLLRKKL